MILSEIVRIISGHLFKTKAEGSRDGKYRVVRIIDINNDGIDWDGLLYCDLDKVNPELLLRKGDILFQAKGKKLRASVVDKDEENVVPVSHFFIFRILNAKILPEYLTWYINQQAAQRYIAQNSVGTGIRHISKQSLSKLDVIIPKLEFQRKIIDLYKLVATEKKLMSELQKNREKLIGNLVNDYINMKGKDYVSGP